MAIGKLAVTRPCEVAKNTNFLSQSSFLFDVEQIDRRGRAISKYQSLREQSCTQRPFEPATPNLESVADT